MTCAELADRLPAIAGGRTELAETEAQHLAECAECAAELRVLSLAHRIGDDLGPVRDAEATAAAVVQRLRASRVTTVRRPWILGAGVAAAAALALMIRVVPSPAPTEVRPSEPTAARQPRAGATVLIALPELDEMDESELEIVFDQLDRLPADALTDGEAEPAADPELARLLNGGEA